MYTATYQKCYTNQQQQANQKPPQTHTSDFLISFRFRMDCVSVRIICKSQSISQTHIIYLCLACSVSTCVEPIRIAPLIYTCLLYSPVISLFMAQSLELAYLESSASYKGQTYTFLRFTIISVIRTDKDVLSSGSDQLP